MCLYTIALVACYETKKLEASIDAFCPIVCSLKCNSIKKRILIQQGVATDFCNSSSPPLAKKSTTLQVVVDSFLFHRHPCPCCLLFSSPHHLIVIHFIFWGTKLPQIASTRY
mmetsp:Transcript_5404/g.11467  ORF Transcript_5404/g.11467 Transcript_5404/m.11467 type:complete len:112 (-) Transcript_5404:403-738(-)